MGRWAKGSTWAGRGSSWGPGHEMGSGWSCGEAQNDLGRLPLSSGTLRPTCCSPAYFHTAARPAGSGGAMEGVGAGCRVLKAPGCPGMRLDMHICFLLQNT